MEIILVVPSPPEVGLVHRAPDPAGPPAEPPRPGTPTQRCADPWRRFWAAAE